MKHATNKNLNNFCIVLGFWCCWWMDRLRPKIAGKIYNSKILKQFVSNQANIFESLALMQPQSFPSMLATLIIYRIIFLLIAVWGSRTIVLFFAGAMHQSSHETLFMTQKKIVGSYGLIKRLVSQGLDRHPKNPGRSRPYASNLFHRAQIAG